MRHCSLGIALGLVSVMIPAPVASAQSKPVPGQATAPTPAQTPDLSGVWMHDAPPATADQYWIYEFTSEAPPMTAWGEAQFNAAKSSFGEHALPIAETNDPVLRECSPPGVPRVYLHPFPVQIVQLPGEVIMLFEYDSARRDIFTDGRPHETRFGPTYMGDSIGRWEGDTLVVDTLNFNDKTWLDRIGHPHSDALHVVERIRRIDHDHLVDDITIEDPKAYKKPWTTHWPFLLRPGWRLTEQFCEEGETFLELENKETAPTK